MEQTLLIHEPTYNRTGKIIVTYIKLLGTYNANIRFTKGLEGFTVNCKTVATRKVCPIILSHFGV